VDSISIGVIKTQKNKIWTDWPQNWVFCTLEAKNVAKKGDFATWQSLIVGLWLFYGLPTGYIASNYSIYGTWGYGAAIFTSVGSPGGVFLFFSPKTCQIAPST